MNVHVLAAPPLEFVDAVQLPQIAAPVPATDSRSPQDWETLVTPGHVLRERLKKGSNRRTILAFVSAAVAAVFAINGPAIVDLRVPPALVWSLLSDPSTYTVLSDGTALPYQAAFLQDLPVQAGMTGAEFVSLVDAVRRDMDRFGVDAASWEATAELPKAPRVTRPAKVFEPASLDSLSSGVVAIPEVQRIAAALHILAYVDGRLSWTVLYDGRCQSLTGMIVQVPGELSCVRTKEANGNIASLVGGFKPVSATAQTKE